MGDAPILYEMDGAVAVLTLNRPELHNAQNAALLSELDAAFRKAERDDAVRVIVLRANGRNFSAGHDMSPSEYERFEREVRRGRSGVAPQYDWERENYLEMTLRWRDLPKPTIAAVQGKCIAGGLMLAWPCDIIVAAEDAMFSDPVVRMGIGGVEYHAHGWELGTRKAKEMLFTGAFVSAVEAEKRGMVNRVVPRADLDAQTMALAHEIATMDPFGLRMAKASLNRAQDAAGFRNAMAAAFELHHLAHAQSQILHAGNSVGGMDVRSMKSGNRA